MNAGIQQEEHRRPSTGGMRRDVERARRRSSIRMNLNLNDPTVPAPGELQISPSGRSRGPWPQSPHHERTPSLGDLHQELEYEQEGQVNRLLNMIRQQQAQITTLQANQAPTSNSAVDDSTPTSERSMSLSAHPPHISQVPAPGNIAQPRSRSPYAISRQSSLASRNSSHHGSPALRPISGGPHESSDWLPGAATSASRDESAFYQAETQMLTRENQMLKLRIRELERQLTERDPNNSLTHSPAVASGLHSPPLSGASAPPSNVEASGDAQPSTTETAQTPTATT
ncbi:hypothetical protein BU24DRAFT_356628 [Aaosphaeria arxii CBS 175.79]|uniref:Uncharacterized protein n=1 Tax=Aaosphaeria arxii CBS 175.79 TaxID=1450172 RepID=A0A6A5XBR1_9PLEO|nr:uncharacterized protein BU24DRAFT_356628 [Aaosphaeria arxii CBS 175.79]KAF2010360.1 hypothetical protein BU24DRAFT_356628 [Aaosphaeria arxii CBS 175.79]